MNTNAQIKLWGTVIGAVTWQEDRDVGAFQFNPDFLGSGIQLAPLMMPLNEFPYEFPALPHETFKGLPGLLADSLPDRFGNAVIDAWLASQGRTPDSFNPVERLCYIGQRGIGALEFEPGLSGPPTILEKLNIASLVSLANDVLDERAGLQGAFSGTNDQKVIEDILRVGTSAGGARAKAVLAWNPNTQEFRSGQVQAGDGFECWLMKFDGIHNNRDKELSDPQGYGKIEYAYHLMALAAGINMSPCRIHHEGGRSHFMTRRFDRTADGDKRHMQSLGGLAHYDYNLAGAYSYEQAIQVIRKLGLPREDLEQQVRRAAFNIMARNQDDHVKNIAFLMDRAGQWRLSPAFDVTYAYDPQGAWTSRHQMGLNGKRDRFEREDLMAFALSAGMKRPKAAALLDETKDAVFRWPEFAAQAEVEDQDIGRISNAHRMNL